MTTVLLDATSLPKKPVGAGVYITNLVHELLSMKSDFDFKVLAHEDDFTLFNLSDDYRSHFIFLADYGRGWRILAEQILYPRICQQYHADLYHGLHYSFPLFSKTPKISTIHDLSFFIYPKKHNFLKRFYFPFFIQKAKNSAKHVLVVSESTKNDLIKFTQTDSAKITVTPLGVDNKFFDPVSWLSKDTVREKYALPQGFILFVGLIEPRKNVPLLIELYLQLMESEQPDIDLVIAGRWGWESRELLDRYRRSLHFSRIHFPGYIDAEDLPALYQSAAVFVYPSDYEGFGLPVLEAMASGTPVITTRVSSMPEFVGEAGLLVEPGDKDSLKAALAHVISEKIISERLGVAGKIKAREYSWKRTAEKTIATYSKVLFNQGG